MTEPTPEAVLRAELDDVKHDRDHIVQERNRAEASVQVLIGERDTYERLLDLARPVLAYVSRGRSFVDARRVLGAIDDAGRTEASALVEPVYDMAAVEDLAAGLAADGYTVTAASIRDLAATADRLTAELTKSQRDLADALMHRNADGSHRYYGTYCVHGQHHLCKRECKTGQEPCVCGCGHPDPDLAEQCPDCRHPLFWHTSADLHGIAATVCPCGCTRPAAPVDSKFTETCLVCDKPWPCPDAPAGILPPKWSAPASAADRLGFATEPGEHVMCYGGCRPNQPDAAPVVVEPAGMQDAAAGGGGA